VHWRDRAGKETRLVAGLDEKQARQLERMIEDRMRVADDLPPGAEPVPWNDADVKRVNADARVEVEEVARSRS
jgi:hypothetical protein